MNLLKRAGFNANLEKRQSSIAYLLSGGIQKEVKQLIEHLKKTLDKQ